MTDRCVYHLLITIVLFVQFFSNPCQCQETCGVRLPQSNGLTTCYTLAFARSTWDIARKQCESRGLTSRLAVVSSAETNAAISNLLQSNGINEAWIGANQTVHQWQWLDGAEVRYQGCYNTAEMDSEEFVVKSTLSGINSVSRCVDECLRIRYQYAALFNGEDCWCGSSFHHRTQGAPCNEPCPGDMQTTCGGSQAIDVYSVSGTYSNWLPEQPYDAIGNTDCAALEMSADGSTVQWKDYVCSRDDLLALCDLGPATVSECNDRPSSFVVADRCIDVISDKMTQFKASAICRQRGSRADLIQLKTDSENQQAVEAVRQRFGTNQQPAPPKFWIGLVRSSWTWHTGADLTYTNWNTHSPTALDSAVKQCVITSRDVDGKWLNVDCDRSKPFICEEVNSTVPIQSTTTVKTSTTTVSLNSLPRVSSSTTSSTSSSQSTVFDFTVTAFRVASNRGPLSTVGLIGIIVAGVIAFIVIAAIIVVVAVCRRRRGESTTNAVGSQPREDVESPVGSKPFYYFGVTTADLRQAEERPESPDVIYSTISTPPPDVVPGYNSLKFDGLEPSAPTMTSKLSREFSPESIYDDCIPGVSSTPSSAL